MRGARGADFARGRGAPKRPGQPSSRGPLANASREGIRGRTPLASQPLVTRARGNEEFLPLPQPFLSFLFGVSEAALGQQRKALRRREDPWVGFMSFAASAFET